MSVRKLRKIEHHWGRLNRIPSSASIRVFPLNNRRLGRSRLGVVHHSENSPHTTMGKKGRCDTAGSDSSNRSRLRSSGSRPTKHLLENRCKWLELAVDFEFQN